MGEQAGKCAQMFISRKAGKQQTSHSASGQFILPLFKSWLSKGRRTRVFWIPALPEPSRFQLINVELYHPTSFTELTHF